MNAIDISSYQGIVDFDKVERDGVEAVIIKIGNIGNAYSFRTGDMDSCFERNYNECKKRGIPVGIYAFNYCRTEEEAREAARWVLDKLSGRTLELPVYIDMENDPNCGFTLATYGKERLTNICIAFNSIIESAGYWSGVYSGLNWFKTNLKSDTIKSLYTTWIAHYGENPMVYEGVYDMVQYTDSGHINGISGYVDLDIMHRDLVSEIAGKEIDPNKKNIEQLANEVIDGLWGNDEDRKKRLLEAGYNYDAVQNRVNEKIAARDNKTYIVRPGDTLSKIAEKYGTTVSELSKMNGISNPNLIYAGQELKVGKGDLTPIYPGQELNHLEYTVKKGDTLSEIAEKYGTTVSELARINGLSNPDIIYPGQELSIRG